LPPSHKKYKHRSKLIIYYLTHNHHFFSSIFNMKKQLLLAAIAVQAVCAIAQQRVSVPLSQRFPERVNQPAVRVEAGNNAGAAALPVRQPSLIINRAANVTRLSGAGNLLTMGSQTNNQIMYVPELNTVAFGHRSFTNAATGSTSSKITYDMSTNGGATWDTTFRSLVNAPAGGTAPTCRYPNFTIYNPPGNTSVAGAFALAVGPALAQNGGGTTVSWGTDYIGAGSLVYTTAANTVTQLDNTPDTAKYIPYNLVATPQAAWYGNAYVDFNGSAVNVANLKNYAHLFVNKLTPNLAGPVLSKQTLVVDMTGVTDTLLVGTGPNVAFDPTGNIGYVMAVVTEANSVMTGAHPVLWKSTDAGANWVKQPKINWRHVDSIMEYSLTTRYLQPGQTSLDTIPYMANFDMVVDNAGDLHVMAEMNSRFSSAPDSAGFLYGGRTSLLTHLYYRNNTWGANGVMVKQNAFYNIGATSSVRQDLNMQAARNAAGTKVFMTFNRTDTTSRGADGYPNDSPDVWAYGYDVPTQKATVPTNLAAGTPAELTSYLAKCSPIAITNGGMTELPIVYAEPGSDAGAASSLVHTKLYYLGGTGFMDTDFTEGTWFNAVVLGTKNTSDINNKLNVFPNPTTGSLKVDLSQFKGNSTIEVTNLLGATVLTATNQNGIATLDLSAQTSGVYFVTVTNTDGRATKKVTLVK
jgi:hypothetical protein